MGDVGYAWGEGNGWEGMGRLGGEWNDLGDGEWNAGIQGTG